ncbi:hypothetical protein PQX77_012513 [Marasmius sp. AFHP31]|nr:hypothetical protein PQX77_012513 [Marasmius sp. AFHP31]
MNLVGTILDILPATGTSIMAANLNFGVEIAIAVFNALLSLLTAGRIWWISREARQHMGATVQKKYNTIVAVIIESGLLYPTTQIVSIIIPLTLDPDARGVIPVDLTFVAILMSGLAPTLIIVRVADKKSVDSVQQMVSMHFAERDTQQATGTSAIQATIDIRSHPQTAIQEIDSEGVQQERKARENMIV